MKIYKSRSAVLLITIILAGWTFFGSSCGNSVQKVIQQEARTITVTGSAEKEIVPDEMYLLVNLEEYNQGGKKIAIDIIKDSLVSELSRLGISSADIKAGSMGGWGGYYWYYRYASKMYKTMQLSVKTKSQAQLDTVFNGLKTKGISYITLGEITHSNILEFRKEVKKEALQAAKEKAGYLAESVEEKIGRVVKVREIADRDGSDAMLLSNSEMIDTQTRGSSYGGTDYQSQTIKIRYEIEASFEIRE